MGVGKLYYCSSTTHIVAYLRTQHSIRRDLTTPMTAPTIVHRPTQTLNNVHAGKEAVRQSLRNWIRGDHIAFRQVQSSRFHQLIAVIVPFRASSLLPTRQTLHRWILEDFNRDRGIIAEKLSVAMSHIHISFDGLTSPNQQVLLGIVAHWTDKEYRFKTALIGLREIQHSCDGINLANIVMQVFQEYNIMQKIGYFIGDNASNMDNAIDKLSPRLFVAGNSFPTDSRRLSCFGHILNLTAKELLDGRVSRHIAAARNRKPTP